MIKRFTPAAVAIALAALATSAAANPYFGFDGRHYGALAAAPDYGHAKGGGSRKGLTAPMLALLDRIESRFGPVNVISGYRPGARIAGTGRISRHASGNAVDIDAGSRKGAIVRWLIANHHNGGTMTYSDMSHIHVDIGPHFVSLGAYSGGGGRGYSRSRRSEHYAAYERSYERGYQRRVERYGYGDDPRTRRSRYAWGYATLYN
jgi:Peptidase M15